MTHPGLKADETRSGVQTALPPPASAAQASIWQGFAGSLMLLLGSLGVGWLASSSSLIRTPVLILARTTPVAVIIATVLLCAGALLMLRAWLRLGKKLSDWGPEAKPLLVKALCLWTAPMMLALPLFSRDSYAYIGQGRLMQQGLDPYTKGISALSNYFRLGPDALWTEAPTPYGPIWLWLEQLAVWLAGGSPELALIPFRLASLAGVVLLAVYVPRLAALAGLNPQRALWLGVLNPVLLMFFVASVHNDSLMLGLVVAGVYYVWARHPVAGIVLVTASVAIKPITLIALPFVGLLWAGPQATWLRKFGIWAATLAISMGLMTLAGIVNGLGFGWLGALQTPGTVWIWYAPVGLVAATLGFLVSLVGGPGASVTDVLHMVGQAVSILLVGVLALVPVRAAADEGGFSADVSDAQRYPRAVTRRMAWAFAAVVLLAPMIQPWYMVWLLVFFTITGIRDGWQLRVVFYLSTFFTLIALTDQLSVFQWIPIVLIRTVAIVVGVLGALHIMFVDRGTRGLFLPSRALEVG